jgi:DMSO reductase anchor subunit
VRTSWLSREIIAFGLFTAVAGAYALVSSAFGASGLTGVLQYIALATGWGGVMCSAMVYVATRREFWNPWYTASRFVLSAGVLGPAFALLIALFSAWANHYASADAVFEAIGARLCSAIIVVTTAKLAVESSVLRHLWSRQNTTLKRSALLLIGALSPVFKIRMICGLVGGVSLPLAMIAIGSRGAEDGYLLGAMAVVTAALLVTGELTERYVFFTAVVAPRMPRGF